jgi:membrane fusion protein (multidrug efflux system)
MKTEEQKRPMLVSIIILAVLIVAGIGYLGYWFIFSKYVGTDEASIDGEHVSISAKMMGRVRNIMVDEGAKVTAGQLLVQLDDTDLQAQEAQSVASLNYANQNLVLAKVNLDRTQADFQRIKTLMDTGNATQEQYDHAAKTLEASKVQYSIAQSQIGTAKAQLGVIDTQLQNTRIVAPISGIVAKKSIMPGEVVQPGQAILTINNLNQIWVTANFEETKIRLIHRGEPVNIRVDAYPNLKFKGRVVQVAAAIVPPPFSIGESTKTTQKIPVKIEFTRIPDSVTLLPGMSVEVNIRVN